MKILLVHQNFPGQFRGLAPALRERGHALVAISMREGDAILGVRHLPYKPARGNGKDIHPWLVSTESAVLRGQAVAERVDGLLREGWTPDLVLGHTGWGEMLMLREVLPHTRLVGFNELYYRAQGGDCGFDPEFPAAPDTGRRLAVRNLHLTASLLACDQGVTPTQWQADAFPPALRDRLQVIHDGIDTARLVPEASATVTLAGSGRRFQVGDGVITFVSRSLEPMRGYHRFLRALPAILARRPQAHAVIVGGDGVSYDPPRADGRSHQQVYLDEVKDRLDLSRVHFVGRLPYDTLVQLLRVSAAHVYLTMPFVLSWSMLEAMSLGALVVGSDTAPVREFIEHERNGLLVDFFDAQALADAVCDALARPQAFEPMRAAARRDMVARYDLRGVCLPRYLRLLEGSA